MTPDFALNLSSKGISLLRRAKGGWVLLDEAALDGDLDTEMRRLRETAEAASPDGTRVKLVIPVDQIKYLDLDDPGSEAERATAARAALDGATPYTVDELRYDWSAREGRLYVAALAGETLDEAESFALTHGFRPVMAVAMPRPRKFKGEPFFGALPSWDGPAPTRDRPIRVLEEPPQEAAPAAARAPAPAAATGTSGAEAAKPAASVASAPAQDTPATSSESRETDTPATPDPSEPPAPAFRSIRAAREAPGATKAKTDEAGDTLTRPVPQRPNADEVRSRLRSLAASDPAQEDTAPASPAAPDDPRAPGVFGHGTEDEKPAPRIARQPTPSVSISKPGPRAPKAPPADTASRIAALRPGREDTPASAAATLDDAQRMTVFGARGTRTQEVGGKPRFLGLMLTAALLIFLVAVAAWASFSLEDSLARIFRPAPEPETQIASVPLPDAAEASPGAQEAAASEPDTRVAALETETDASASAAPADPQAAAATYAATGIWQRAPTAPADLQPGELDTEEVYLLSLDAPVTEHDAIALPEAAAQVNDAPYPAPMPPAPADVDFDLDSRGLVRATDEGAINPDRVRVFAGLPPAVPPTRESALPEGAEEAQSAADVARLKALGDTRPEGRPVTLVEDNERITFRGVTITELASIRPALRPAPAKAEAEEDTTATERAVEASLVPPLRPDDFGSVVEETRRLAAQVAPRTVEPAAPSGSTVAQRATVSNALDLRKMNLIGVYGEPSSRRALVRLPNGRYQKVKVGDRVDGGRIAAIGEDQLRYVKGGLNMTLQMP